MGCGVGNQAALLGLLVRLVDVLAARAMIASCQKDAKARVTLDIVMILFDIVKAE